MESDSHKSKLLSVTVIKERKCRRKYVYKSKVTEYLVKTKETATTNITKRVLMNKKYPKQARKHTEKSFSKYSSSDRIVPTCFRSKCQKLHSATENDSIHRHRESLRPRERVVMKEKKRGKKAKCESNKKHCKKHCQHHHKKKLQKDFNDNLHVLLSPISLSPLMDDTKSTHLSYDDISSDTISTYSTSKIDRLIKKTRERERRSLQEWPLLPKLYSTGNHGRNTDNSDVESLHSAATLVINSQTSSKNVDAAGPKIKKEKIDDIDYMQPDLKIEENNIGMIENIKTEVINEMGVENSLQPCKDEPMNREPYYVALQSGEITTNVFSPVENCVVIDREKTNIKCEYLCDSYYIE